METFLKSEGHTVSTAFTGTKGLEALEQKKPDLVIADIRLPDQSGLDILKTIKSKHPQVPVVMITGFKDAESVLDAFRHGAMDCLLKPINFDYLRLHILSRITT